MQNFSQQLQTPISQKQKMFSGFFIAYLEWASNLEHFEKKDEHPSLVISEIIDSERVGYLTSKGLASEHHSVSNVLTGSRH